MNTARSETSSIEIMSFPTGTIADLKLQYVREDSKSKQIFLKALEHFLSVKGGVISQLPIINGKLLDLYDFYHKVDRKKGFDNITNIGAWREITSELGLSTTQVPDENIVKEWYSKFLLAFEIAIKRHSSAASHNTQIKRPLPPNQVSPAIGGQSQRPDPVDASGQPLIKRARTSQASGPTSVFNQGMPLPAQAQQHQQQQQPWRGPDPSSAPMSQRLSQPPPPRSTVSSHAAKSAGPGSTLQQSSTAPSASSSSITTGAITSQNMVSIISGPKVAEAIRHIRSADINEVHTGLNYLMQATMEADNPLNAKNTLYVEKYPSLLAALGDLLDAANPFTKVLFTFDDDGDDDDGDAEDTGNTSNGGSVDSKRKNKKLSHTLLTSSEEENMLWRDKNPLDSDKVLRVCCRLHV